MSKTYTCRDVGVDCDWNTSEVHPTIELTPELVEAVRGAIKDE
jgi:predicted small metal-binding protein